MINTIRGRTEKPVAAEQLAELLAADPDLNGILYLGYPIIGTPEGAFPIDALLVSPEKGLVMINLVEGVDLSEYGDLQDNVYNKMSAKLLQHSTLISKRNLQVQIHTVTFAPAIQDVAARQNEGYPLCNANNLKAELSALDDSNPAYYKALASVIQSISTLRRGKKRREIKRDDSRGAIAKRLEDSIATLDNAQGAAVVETFDGVQRIRGLAGSGKTIVLALKVAYLHSSNPDWNIAVTFNTRSLKGQFESLINTFVLEQTNEEPDWDKVHILNAWGAPGSNSRTGIYYQFCVDHGIPYMDFGSAKNHWGWDDAFFGVCEKALSEFSVRKPRYDVILVDEAQDFSPNFLRLCYEFLNEPRRLVYAYDELQNLGKVSLPPMETIFGNDSEGNPRVTLTAPTPGRAKQDIVLDVCYRNSRPVLSAAHALGFGIYRDSGLVQMFEDESLWQEVGYAVTGGSMGPGHEISLRRTSESSPEFLENHSPIDDLITFEVCSDSEAQDIRLVDQIKANLENDELTPDDIIVINTDPITTKRAVAKSRGRLHSEAIDSNVAGVTSSADVFRESGKVTFTGIYRAKGNEAPMVYIINAQDCFTNPVPRNRAKIRNRLFTAITRSKAWVRVLGYGPDMEALKKEFERLKEHNFALNFVYPTDEEREEMTIINRDISAEERELIDRKQYDLEQIVESLENGETFLADYPEGVINKLKDLLNR